MRAATHREQDRVGVRRDEADHDVRGDREAGQPAAVRDDVGRDLALDADADRGVGADADGEREDEQEQLGAPAAPVHEAHERAWPARHQQVRLRVRRRHLAGEALDRAAGVVEAAGVDALADLVGVEVGEPVELDVGASRRARTGRGRAGTR